MVYIGDTSIASHLYFLESAESAASWSQCHALIGTETITVLYRTHAEVWI